MNLLINFTVGKSYKRFIYYKTKKRVFLKKEAQKWVKLYLKVL